MYRQTKAENHILKESRRNLSSSLRKLRADKNQSREDLALECGITPGYLLKIEHGAANASLDILDKISQGTGISVAELLSK